MPIIRVKNESQTIKTFTFRDKLCASAQPGQFLMLWIPQIDEIPLSIMNSQNGIVSVTVKALGTATKALHRMKKGEIIGVRGPFGNFFTKNFDKVLMIGGGTGIAPLFFLVRRLMEKRKKITFIIGAKTKDELLFLSSLKKLCKNHTILSTTEDGSYGLKCISTDPLNELLNREKYDIIYTCGPEPMIRKVFDIAKIYNTTIEASLERFMRCGIGLCGSCVIGKYRVCRDGPIFSSTRLGEIQDEFGFSKLDRYGKAIPI
jgi:dihydroorotate dehydrogenase electron transfer subunit